MDTQELYEQNASAEENIRILEVEIKKFNWGAFGWSWIWGACNGAFKETFVPWLILIASYFVIGFIMPHLISVLIVFAAGLAYQIYLGLHGNQWAWDGKAWKDVDHFTRIQKSWAIATLVVYIINILSTALYLILVAGALVFMTSDIVKAPTLHTAKMFVTRITMNEEIAKSENGKEIASRLVEVLNAKESSESSPDSPPMLSEYRLYNNNTIQVLKYDYMEEKQIPKELYTFYKKGTCSIETKNCYIIAYEIQNKKPVPVSKVYYSADGKTKGINLQKKK